LHRGFSPVFTKLTNYVAALAFNVLKING
jgi:hypothetical protein